jgi:hypothetical protein
MRAGLIGHTGFVGGNLLHQAASDGTPFDALFNSSTIDAIRGSQFDLLVCAGVSAVKWQANRDPAADQRGIDRLTSALAEVQARELVLISTIDVYPHPAGGGDEATPIEPAGHHAYGRHRLALEQWCRDRFPLLRVIRLPALFGPGLRKNALYDLLNDNMPGTINPAAAFQWYPLDRLWSDIGIARRAGLDLVNLFPEPILMRDIIAAAFPGASVGPEVRPAPRYAMQTRHARLFGGGGGYIMDAARSLDAMQRFVDAAKAAARPGSGS